VWELPSPFQKWSLPEVYEKAAMAKIVEITRDALGDVAEKVRRGRPTKAGPMQEAQQRGGWLAQIVGPRTSAQATTGASWSLLGILPMFDPPRDVHPADIAPLYVV
jgi:hypothetical protein